MSIINTAEIQKLKKTKLDKKGGSMTGPLYLQGDPVENFEAVNKGYLDTEVNRIDLVVTSNSDDVSRIDQNLAVATGAFNISRFEFTVPSSEWIVEHNMGTTRFSEKLLDKNNRSFFASIEVIDNNSFKVYLSEMMTGAVEVSFGI